MIGLYILGIVILGLYTILICIISYENGFKRGVESIRSTYLRSLAEIKNNFEHVGRIIKEMENDNITSVKSIQVDED